MATPVQRDSSSAPAPYTPYTAAEPVPVASPLGWVLILSGGIGLILASWLLYPIDYTGMWAGYRDGILGTVVVMCAMALNTSLPAKVFLGLTGLCGVLAVLFAVFLDNPTRVFVPELVFGVIILVGTGLRAAGRR
jgi:hypothetical protein